MAVAELLKNMSRDTLTPIIKNDGTDSFLLNSYVCGYYAYWNAITNDSVHCNNEEGNEFNIMAVALFRDESLKQNFVGHVPVHLLRIFCFLKLPGCSTSVTLTSKRVSHSADDGLEIPVEYKFFRDKSVVTWGKMQIKKFVCYISVCYVEFFYKVVTVIWRISEKVPIIYRCVLQSMFPI